MRQNLIPLSVGETTVDNNIPMTLTMDGIKTEHKDYNRLIIAASLFVLYVTLGSLYFTLTPDEALSFTDSLYFLIISFTTVG